MEKILPIIRKEGLADYDLRRKVGVRHRLPLIRELFNLYASGQHSLCSLLAEMNQRGLLNHSGQLLSLHGIETILNNPFYTSLIEIKRTGETYKGIHKPIIPTSLFRRVQDIKSGRAGPKVTKHNHLFRGLFRCGLCNRPMSPELQKGRVYYRCQERACETKTVREDILDDHISIELAKLEISDEDGATMIQEWNEGLVQIPNDELSKSLQLRIDATVQGLSRAADLLIEGTLDNETYLVKKREANLTLASLQEEIRNLPDPEEIEANNLKFIELMKNLTGLYETLKPAEKRMFVENTFSNRTVAGKKLCLEPFTWVTQSQDGQYVPSGEPARHRDRTSIVSDDILALRRVLKLKDDNSQRKGEVA